MSYIAELLGQVFGSLLRNRLRSLLTMAGIAWGIASIVVIAALGDSFKQGQRNNMKQLGENIVILLGGRTELQAGGERAGRLIRLNYSDVENLRQEAWLAGTVAAELDGNVHATSPYNSGSFDAVGVESLFPRLRTLPIGDGRFFSEREEKDGARVCVIGAEVKKQLFGDRSGVEGSEVAINSLPYRIVGVLARKNQNTSYAGIDEQKIWLPYTSMTRDVPPAKYYVPGYLDEILYQPRSLGQYQAAQLQVRRVLARAHGFDPADTSAIGMWDTVEDMERTAEVFDTMTLFLGLIAAVTLSLGGIGVMNIMLVTVSERTSEIGLRKALGATRLRIMNDFLAEGCVLAFLSGLAGLGIAFGISGVLRLFPMPDVFPGLPVDGATTAIAFGALTFTAVASALLPAWRAASMTPVEALRDER
jgi:putative ABC transport system permease protein